MAYAKDGVYCDSCGALITGVVYGPEDGPEYCRHCAEEMDPESDEWDPDNPANW
jgi:hypothetical protein